MIIKLTLVVKINIEAWYSDGINLVEWEKLMVQKYKDYLKG